MLNTCSRCAAPLSDEARACPRCGAPRAFGSASPSSELADTRERRELTVLFCDLGGYTEWNEEAEPEEVAAIMDRIKQDAVQTFEAHGGVANQFVGDEIVGLFGIATSHDDAPCRAVAAALALHARVRGRTLLRASGEPRPLRLHSGIETGLVYVRVRDPRAGLWDVTGDTVNTAARLRALADSDQILLGPVTERLVAPYFELEPLPKSAVRGKAQPIAPFRVVKARSAGWRFEVARARGLTRYVGRSAPLARLRGALEQARLGHGGLLVVEGPPGIGKTRLFYEFKRELAKAPERPLVFHGRCLGYGEIAPYQPFVHALLGGARAGAQAGARALARMRRFRLLSSAQLSALAYLLTPDGDEAKLALQGDLLRSAIVDALIELVSALARRRPLLLLFEDFHWADQPSRALLQQLAHSSREQRVLIAVNQRPNELAERPLAGPGVGAQQLALPACDEPSTEAIACAVCAVPRLPPDFARFIYERSQGNPFFVEEICRSLLESGVVRERGDKLLSLQPLGALRVPSTVQVIVRGRIDRLSLPQKRLLRVAAVIGVEFALELLGALAGAPLRELEAQLSELSAQGLVRRARRAPASYRFQHSITQEVAYESVPLDERRRLHGELARLCERALPGELEAKYEILAHHYGRSAVREKAIDYAILAGDKAWHSHSLEPADAHYRRALELLEGARGQARESAPKRIAVSVRWARVGLYNPHPDQVAALRRAEQLAGELGDARGVCLCLNWISWLEYALGNQPEASEASGTFLAAAEALGDAALIAQALTNLGLSHAMACDYQRARALIGRGIARRGRFAGTSYAYALGYLAMIAGDRGEFAEAEAQLAQAAAIVEPSRRLTLFGPLQVQRAMVESWHGQWQACAATARAAHRVALRIDGSYIRAMSLSFEGSARFLQGRDPVGIALMREANALLEGRGIRLHLSLCASALADALALSGRYDEARAAAGEALSRAAQGDRLGEVSAWRALATVRALGDRALAGAREAVTRALELAAQKGSPREQALTRLRWAELLHAHDRAAEAESERAHASALARSLGLQP